MRTSVALFELLTCSSKAVAARADPPARGMREPVATRAIGHSCSSKVARPRRVRKRSYAPLASQMIVPAGARGMEALLAVRAVPRALPDSSEHSLFGCRVLLASARQKHRRANISRPNSSVRWAPSAICGADGNRSVIRVPADAIH
jgi:hypothetical protein